jgi:hypothetical protein
LPSADSIALANYSPLLFIITGWVSVSLATKRRDSQALNIRRPIKKWIWILQGIVIIVKLRIVDEMLGWTVKSRENKINETQNPAKCYYIRIRVKLTKLVETLIYKFVKFHK